MKNILALIQAHSLKSMGAQHPAGSCHDVATRLKMVLDNKSGCSGNIKNKVIWEKQ